jgi:EAL domain-containing protein (putative c-di-GMP-specific phosphodiesterase class I)/GGDEF domain-containing protein
MVPLHIPVTGGEGPLARVLRKRAIYPVFQPIAKLSDGTVYAHEALIRGPKGTAMQSADALLRAAFDEDLIVEFEYACIVATLNAWQQMQCKGRLFVNVSANALVHICTQYGQGHLHALICEAHIPPRMLVIEITEHERVSNMDALTGIVSELRTSGMTLALDDFGDGHSSLRLWAQLKPEVVKIDKYFTSNLSQQGDKFKTIQALQHIASLFGSELVAEGIETPQDMRILRDMGITYGQGYLLGLPDPLPAHELLQTAQEVVEERQVAVFPDHGPAPVAGQLRNLSVIRAPTVDSHTSNDEVARLFIGNGDLHALAVLEGGRSVGIINRVKFMNEYSKLYYREVWGRKPCTAHINRSPRIIEREHNVEDLIGILTSQDQRYLSDGFIVCENGRYLGLGTGDHLVRSVTETRIEAARHANPLTFLPGNIPISQHMERLLSRCSTFVACYADLNNFKPFNDYYGYWRGDEMIRLVARIAKEQCDAQCDFLGHVGGDDFILLFQSQDWQERCECLVEEFNQRAFDLFDEQARAAGGIHAEDRHGVSRFFPCTTLTIGAVRIDSQVCKSAQDVANLAAQAKHAAKHGMSGVLEWRAQVPQV